MQAGAGAALRYPAWRLRRRFASHGRCQDRACPQGCAEHRARLPLPRRRCPALPALCVVWVPGLRRTTVMQGHARPFVAAAAAVHPQELTGADRASQRTARAACCCACHNRRHNRPMHPGAAAAARCPAAARWTAETRLNRVHAAAHVRCCCHRASVHRCHDNPACWDHARAGLVFVAAQPMHLVQACRNDCACSGAGSSLAALKQPGAAVAAAAASARAAAVAACSSSALQAAAPPASRASAALALAPAVAPARPCDAAVRGQVLAFGWLQAQVQCWHLAAQLLAALLVQFALPVPPSAAGRARRPAQRAALPAGLAATPYGWERAVCACELPLLLLPAEGQPFLGAVALMLRHSKRQWAQLPDGCLL